jgi:hypothetical protein
LNTTGHDVFAVNPHIHQGAWDDPKLALIK